MSCPEKPKMTKTWSEQLHMLCMFKTLFFSVFWKMKRPYLSFFDIAYLCRYRLFWYLFFSTSSPKNRCPSDGKSIYKAKKIHYVTRWCSLENLKWVFFLEYIKKGMLQITVYLVSIITLGSVSCLLRVAIRC